MKKKSLCDRELGGVEHGWWDRLLDQMLSVPLRALCGITTKTPHFELVCGGVSRDSASTEYILSKISPSPLTHAIFGAILLA